MLNKRQDPGSVTVVGLGYIGLPTAVFLAAAGLKVSGYDIDENRVSAINSGALPFVEPNLEKLLSKVVFSGALKAFTELRHSATFIVAVPTPIDGDRNPDDSCVIDAVVRISSLLKGGELIVVESTSPPGLTEKVAEIIISRRSDLTLSPGLPNSLYFAYAPERVLPGKIVEEFTSNDRVVGGLNREASELTVGLYSKFCRGKIHVTDSRTAEMAKLAENAFRDVNIAFANELSMISEDLGIDVWDLISLANRHPRVNILEPGPGVGGHCIAVDPWFIVSSSPQNSKLIPTARMVNIDKKLATVSKINDWLTDLQATKKSPIILGALGLSFKADIDDLRESPALSIVEQLAREHPSVEISVVEPYITTLPPELSKLTNVRRGTLESVLDDSDLLVILVDHSVFKANIEKIGQHPRVIDTRGLLRGYMGARVV